MQIANNTVNFLEFETLASLKFERTRERINEHEQSEIVPGEMRNLLWHWPLQNTGEITLLYPVIVGPNKTLEAEQFI